MRDVRVKASVAMYLVLAAVGWGLCLAFDRDPWRAAPASAPALPHIGPIAARIGEIALGLVVGAALVALSRYAMRRWVWARHTIRELRLGLHGLDERAALPLAVASAVGEEIFFRGFVQPGLVGWFGPAPGLLAASLIFGAAHIPWNRQLVPWTAMALCAGVIFGLLFLLTGGLLAVIVAHGTINYVNLRFILSNDEPDERRSEPDGAHVVPSRGA